MIQESHSWAYIQKKNSNSQKYMLSNIHNDSIYNSQDLDVT